MDQIDARMSFAGDNILILLVLGQWQNIWNMRTYSKCYWLDKTGVFRSRKICPPKTVVCQCSSDLTHRLPTATKSSRRIIVKSNSRDRLAQHWEEWQAFQAWWTISAMLPLRLSYFVWSRSRSPISSRLSWNFLSGWKLRSSMLSLRSHSRRRFHTMDFILPVSHLRLLTSRSHGLSTLGLGPGAVT